MDQLDSRLPLQKLGPGAPQNRNIDSVVIRTAMIEHHYSAAPGTQHSMNFLDCFFSLRRVMQNAMGIDQVKTLVCEVEILSICRLKLSWKIEQFKTLARKFNSSFRKIHSGVIRARFSKLGPICPQSTADLQYL